MLWALSDDAAWLKRYNAPSAISADGKSITMQSVNLAYQEDGRKFVWHNTANAAAVSLTYADAKALTAAISNKYLQMRVRLDQAASAEVKIAVMCQRNRCLNAATMQPLLQHMTPGKWYSIALPVQCDSKLPDAFAAEEALRFSTTQPFSLAVADIALVNTVEPSAMVLQCGQ